MPVTLRLHKDWTRDIVRQLYMNDGSFYLVNSSAAYYAILCNNLALSDTSTIAEILASELTYSPTGYTSRQNIVFPTGVPIDDTINKRWRTPLVTWTVAPNANLTYTHVWLLADSEARTNKPITGVTVANPGVFTCVDHGLSENDPIVITGTGQPGGVSATTVYYANVVTSNTFRLKVATDSVTYVQTTSAGSGVVLRYAKGKPVCYRNEGVATQILSGASVSFNFSMTEAAYAGIGEGA